MIQLGFIQLMARKKTETFERCLACGRAILTSYIPILRRWHWPWPLMILTSSTPQFFEGSFHIFSILAVAWETPEQWWQLCSCLQVPTFTGCRGPPSQGSRQLPNTGFFTVGMSQIVTGMPLFDSIQSLGYVGHCMDTVWLCCNSGHGMHRATANKGPKNSSE